MNISDGVCAYVAGGLGNQLFILAAAWEQATRLDAPLYLDTSFHAVKGVWDYELGTLNAPGVLLGDASPWRSLRLSKERVIPVPRIAHPLIRRTFLEKDSSRFDPRINSISRGTTLFGYFQSESYFPTVAAQIRDLILAAPETQEETNYLERLAVDKRVTVHLRRGDYLNAAADHILIASTDYAVRARELLRRLGQDYPLRVFSDSPDLVRQELAGAEVDIEFIENDGVLSPINTIKAMASGEAFIMSNSSFSWWAAWLMQQGRPDSLVVAPRPWNDSGTAKADMLKRDWISLDAR